MRRTPLEAVTLAENVRRGIPYRRRVTRPPRTHCRRGHIYYIQAYSGKRYCRQCMGRTSKWA